MEMHLVIRQLEADSSPWNKSSALPKELGHSQDHHLQERWLREHTIWPCHAWQLGTHAQHQLCSEYLSRLQSVDPKVQKNCARGSCRQLARSALGHHELSDSALANGWHTLRVFASISPAQAKTQSHWISDPACCVCVRHGTWPKTLLQSAVRTPAQWQKEEAENCAPLCLYCHCGKWLSMACLCLVSGVHPLPSLRHGQGEFAANRSLPWHQALQLQNIQVLQLWERQQHARLVATKLPSVLMSPDFAVQATCSCP